MALLLLSLPPQSMQARASPPLPSASSLLSFHRGGGRLFLDSASVNDWEEVSPCLPQTVTCCPPRPSHLGTVLPTRLHSLYPLRAQPSPHGHTPSTLSAHGPPHRTTLPRAPPLPCQLRGDSSRLPCLLLASSPRPLPRSHYQSNPARASRPPVHRAPMLTAGEHSLLLGRKRMHAAGAPLPSTLPRS